MATTNYVCGTPPNPARIGSRVENRCLAPSLSSLVFKGAGSGSLANATAQYYKANVLQHKANQNPLSKQQIYAQKAKKLWNYPKRTYATQGAAYTNMNTQMLLQSGNDGFIYVNSGLPVPDIGGGITCPTDPTLPPYLQVIPNGGILNCSTTYNPCTNKYSYTKTLSESGSLTCSSDVPGPIETLYWKQEQPSFFPRRRYIMNNETANFG
jgi:hypothetical protein